MSTDSASVVIRSCTSGAACGEQRALLVGDVRGRARPARLEVRHHPRRSGRRRRAARRWVALIASAFFRSKRAGLGLTRSMSNASTISSIVKMSRSSAIAQPSRAR